VGPVALGCTELRTKRTKVFSFFSSEKNILPFTPAAPTAQRLRIEKCLPVPPSRIAPPPRMADPSPPEAVRLIIWDLDQTFWKGTITEGSIEYQDFVHHIVIALAKRGILNSIC